MPGTLHQGILALFRADPWLAFDILGVARPVAGLPVAARAEVEFQKADKPLMIRQGFPDLVLIYKDPRDPKRGVVITVEAQKDRNSKKRFMVPVYQALLALEHGLATYVVVVSFSRGVSRAFARWSTGPPPKVDVMLLDVETVAKTPWLDADCDRPAAVVLAATLHARTGDLDAARRGLAAARTMAPDQRRGHAMTILAALPDHLRQQLIGELPVQQRDDLLDIERESGTFAFGRREGRAEGREEGREEGRRLALIDLTLAHLEDRGIVVDADSEARIRRCKDPLALQAWARRAPTVTSVSELFEQ